jgi:hypothetical protein
MGVAIDRTLPLETRIRIAASYTLGFRYGTGASVRFPSPYPGVTVKISPHSSQIDCSSFTAWILSVVYPDAPWDKTTYGDMQIFDAARPWSPIEAVERAGVGSRTASRVPGAWALCQAWKDARTDDGDSLGGGHARIIRFDEEGDGVLVLDSSTRSSRGPGWSRITWDKLQALYREDGDEQDGVRFAVLAEG